MVFLARSDGEVHKKGTGHFVMHIETGMNLILYISGHIYTLACLINVCNSSDYHYKYLSFVNRAMYKTSFSEGSAIEQLQNVTAVEGMNATLNCTVTGIPMPSVSWFEVKTGNRFSENPLVFANVSRQQAGEYICEATNPCGNDSKKGILIVNCKYIYFLGC